MLGKSNETLPKARDSFYDDGDGDDNDENSTVPATPIISSIRIVASKPPIYRQQSQSSSSPSRSSCDTDHDVTDVSSIGGEHHQVQQQRNHQHHRHQRQQQHQHEDHQQKLDHDPHHSFQLQSMRHVLLGSSVPTSRPPSPADPQQHLTKKQVRIVADDTDKDLQNHSQRSLRHHHHHHHHQQQQPYIHGHTKDYRRVRLTSSAINRQKQQQRIERENLRILERLQHTRATSSLKRDELLSHYDRQIGYVTCPPPPPPPLMPSHISLPSRPSSATIMSSTFSTSGKKSNNPSSRPSSASHPMNSNNIRSRPPSASTSLHGSSRSSSARRPIWNDRWQQHE